MNLETDAAVATENGVRGAGQVVRADVSKSDQGIVIAIAVGKAVHCVEAKAVS